MPFPADYQPYVPPKITATSLGCDAIHANNDVATVASQFEDYFTQFVNDHPSIDLAEYLTVPVGFKCRELTHRRYTG